MKRVQRGFFPPSAIGVAVLVAVVYAWAGAEAAGAKSRRTVAGFSFLEVGGTYCVVLAGANSCGGDSFTITDDMGNGWIRDSNRVWINLNLIGGLAVEEKK